MNRQHRAGRLLADRANVNPAVPHPRWSQATERVIGTDKRVPTQIFNGYGAYVADIYKNLQNERLYA